MTAKRAAAGILRERTPGNQLWRLQHPRGEVHACELHDHSNVGAGWEVLLLKNGELMIGRRCESEAHARYVANAWRQDTARAGL